MRALPQPRLAAMGQPLAELVYQNFCQKSTLKARPLYAVCQIVGTLRVLPKAGVGRPALCWLCPMLCARFSVFACLCLLWGQVLNENTANALPVHGGNGKELGMQHNAVPHVGNASKFI